MLQLRLTQLLNLVLLASLVAADVFDPHLAIQIARSDALPRATNHGPKDVSHTFQRDTVSQGAIKINNAGEAYSTVLVNGASAPPAAPMVALPDGSVLVGVASTTAAQEMFFGQ